MSSFFKLEKKIFGLKLWLSCRLVGSVNSEKELGQWVAVGLHRKGAEKQQKGKTTKSGERTHGGRWRSDWEGEEEVRRRFIRSTETAPKTVTTKHTDTRNQECECGWGDFASGGVMNLLSTE